MNISTSKQHNLLLFVLTGFLFHLTEASSNKTFHIETLNTTARNTSKNDHLSFSNSSNTTSFSNHRQNVSNEYVNTNHSFDHQNHPYNHHNISDFYAQLNSSNTINNQTNNDAIFFNNQTNLYNTSGLGNQSNDNLSSNQSYRNLHTRDTSSSSHLRVVWPDEEQHRLLSNSRHYKKVLKFEKLTSVRNNRGVVQASQVDYPFQYVLINGVNLLMSLWYKTNGMIF